MGLNPHVGSVPGWVGGLGLHGAGAPPVLKEPGIRGSGVGYLLTGELRKLMVYPGGWASDLPSLWGGGAWLSGSSVKAIAPQAGPSPVSVTPGPFWVLNKTEDRVSKPSMCLSKLKLGTWWVILYLLLLCYVQLLCLTL